MNKIPMSRQYLLLEKHCPRLMRITWFPVLDLEMVFLLYRSYVGILFFFFFSFRFVLSITKIAFNSTHWQHQRMIKRFSVSIQMRDFVMDLKKYWDNIENWSLIYDLQVWIWLILIIFCFECSSLTVLLFPFLWQGQHHLPLSLKWPSLLLSKVVASIMC